MCLALVLPSARPLPLATIAALSCLPPGEQHHEATDLALLFVQWHHAKGGWWGGGTLTFLVSEIHHALAQVKGNWLAYMG